MNTDRASFLKAVGIEHPIVQAPMAGVATPELAAAVSNAGALGSLGIGASTADQARQMIEATKALTDRPFNVNVFCHAPAQRDRARESAWLSHLAPLFEQAGAKAPEALDEIYTTFHEDADTFEMLLEQRPAVISFHFGIPATERLKAFKKPVSIRWPPPPASTKHNRSRLPASMQSSRRALKPAGTAASSTRKVTIRR